MKTVDYYVKGAKYTIYFGNRDDLKPLGLEDDNCGECFYYKKVILVLTDFDDVSKDEKEQYIKETLAHELSHAYLYETGMLNYCHDESLVDWMSVVCFNLVDSVHDIMFRV